MEHMLLCLVPVWEGETFTAAWVHWSCATVCCMVGTATHVLDTAAVAM